MTSVSATKPRRGDTGTAIVDSGDVTPAAAVAGIINDQNRPGDQGETRADTKSTLRGATQERSSSSAPPTSERPEDFADDVARRFVRGLQGETGVFFDRKL